MSLNIAHRYNPHHKNSIRLNPASVRERIIAQFIDGIILGAVIGAFLAVKSKGEIYALWASPIIPVFLIQHVQGVVPQIEDWWWGGYFLKITIPFMADLNLAYPSPVQWLIYLIYYSVFHNIFGQTPGKMIKGLVVLSGSESLPSIKFAVLRWLLYVVSIIPLGLGFWMFFFSGKKLTLYDQILGTQVFNFIRDDW